MSYFPGSIVLIAMIAVAILLSFSWMNQRSYVRRLEESRKAQQKILQEASERSEATDAALREAVQELKAIRQLLENRKS